jgi:hypothetical protein
MAHPELQSQEIPLIDHIGFEVKDLDGFYKTLQAQGIEFEGPVRQSANASQLKVAFLTDLWGTRIELTEGSTPLRSDALASFQRLLT